MPVVHVVRQGETVSALVASYGGSWSSEAWRKRIQQLNPHIQNFDRIEVNQLVLIPEKLDEMVFQHHVDYVARVRNAANDGFLRTQLERFAREQEEATRKQQFLSRLDRIPGLANSGVIAFVEPGPPVVIRSPQGPERKTLIIKETRSPEVSSRVMTEAAGMVLSCGSAVLGVIAILGGSVLVPFSGGASTALVYLATAATAASAVQCVVGIGRTSLLTTGDTATVDWLDSQEWYVYTTLALDGIAVVGGTAAAATSIKTVLALKKAAPAKSMFEILRSMGRHERKRLTEDLARANTPGLSNKALKEMIRTGAIPKRFSQLQITQSMRTQVIDLLGAGATMIGSGLSGIINRAGTVVSIILLQEVPET